MNKPLYLSVYENTLSSWGSIIDEPNGNFLFQKIFPSERFYTRNYWNTITSKENKESFEDFFNEKFNNLFFSSRAFFPHNIKDTVFTSNESSSKMNVFREDYKLLLKEQEPVFIRLLKETDFIDGMDNRATEYFSNLLSNYKDNVLIWIQDVFLQNIKDDTILVKILSLFLDYTYGELYPASQMIALASKEHSSTAVKSMVFSLFGHWCNKESLELLDAFSEPQELWLKMKYDTLKKVIRRRCGM